MPLRPSSDPDNNQNPGLNSDEATDPENGEDGSLSEHRSEINRKALDPLELEQKDLSLDESVDILLAEPSEDSRNFTMWPLMLHKEEAKEFAIQWIPKMVQILSQPVNLDLRKHLQAIFDRNKGRGSCMDFDYDQDGYLIQRTLDTERHKGKMVDTFDYLTSKDGKVPVTMTRRVRREFDRYVKETKPIIINFQDWQDWLEKNPHGFSRVSKESLDPQELDIDDYSVEEYRSGFRFTRIEDFENALVTCAVRIIDLDGFVKSLDHRGGDLQDAVEPYTRKVIQRKRAAGVALPRVGTIDQYVDEEDRAGFVKEIIMEKVYAAEDAVKKSPDANAQEKVYGSFVVSKSGFELTLTNRAVEKYLVGQLNRLNRECNRGLSRSTMTVPINQTNKDGYFLVDVAEVCEKMGLPLNEDEVAEYIRSWVKAYQTGNQDKVTLLEDVTRGITISLDFTTHDWDVQWVDLGKLFSTDGRAIWGPLRKDIWAENEKENKWQAFLKALPKEDVEDFGVIKDKKMYYPKIVIRVTPLSGEDRYDPNTLQRINDIFHDFIEKLNI